MMNGYLNKLTDYSVRRTKQLENAFDLLKGDNECRILIEGLSGYGKTTYLGQLKEYLTINNYRVLWHVFSRAFYKNIDDDINRFDINISEQIACLKEHDIQEIANKTNYIVDNLANPPKNLVLLIDAIDETDQSPLSLTFVFHL